MVDLSLEAVGERIREVVGAKWGEQKVWAERLGVSQASLSGYLSGKARPQMEFLHALAREAGVSVDWLLTGEGQSTRSPNESLRSTGIPVLGRVPAGPPGSRMWQEVDAQDLMKMVIPPSDPWVIALQVDGESMFPTLWPGDYVALSPQTEPRPRDLVVAEVLEDGEDYSENYAVKRLGRPKFGQVQLISDNVLHYEPKVYPANRVRIRGKVVATVRAPDGRDAQRLAAYDEGLLEFYHSDEAKELLKLMHELKPRARQVAIRQVRELLGLQE